LLLQSNLEALVTPAGHAKTASPLIVSGTGAARRIESWKVRPSSATRYTGLLMLVAVGNWMNNDEGQT
jgi:hypothetical protein